MQVYDPLRKIEITLELHPVDHRRALSAAREANMDEQAFYALALHLGTLAILHGARPGGPDA